jgi:azurin
VYGSPVVDDKNCAVTGIKVSDDRTKVRLQVEGLREKYIHEIKIPGLVNNDNISLLHNTAYYTLNAIPDGAKISGHKKVTATASAAHDHSAHVAAATGEAPKATTESTEKLGKRTTKQPASWTKGPDQTIVMGTKPGLKFDKTELTVKAGSRIKLEMTNSDDMPHNLLIVKEGTSEKVGQAALALGLKGNEMGYIPNLPEVLFHTKLIQPGSSDEIYFVAPTKPGTYTYVCTYPGHYLTMKGTLIVK